MSDGEPEFYPTEQVAKFNNLPQSKKDKLSIVLLAFNSGNFNPEALIKMRDNLPNARYVTANDAASVTLTFNEINPENMMIL